MGTGPATAAAGRPVSPLLVGWSDDGARTWERAALPVDLAAVASRTTRSAVRSTAVAAGPAGTVVVGVLDASLDVARSLPAGVSAPHGWAYSATGVDLLGPDRGAVCPQPESAPAPAKEAGTDPTGEVQPAWCPAGDGSREGAVVSAQDARGVTASFTWEQLGVDGDLLRAVRRQLVAFAAPPGSDRFERLEVPDVAHVQGPVLLDASEDGFQVVATTAAGIAEPQLVMLASPDGRSWTAGEPLPAGWAAAAGRVGGVTTVVAQDGRGPVLVRARRCRRLGHHAPRRPARAPCRQPGRPGLGVGRPVRRRRLRRGRPRRRPGRRPVGVRPREPGRPRLGGRGRRRAGRAPGAQRGADGGGRGRGDRRGVGHPDLRWPARAAGARGHALLTIGSAPRASGGRVSRVR